MIRFRQKTFTPALLAGLLTPGNALIAGTSIAGMKQSADQAEEQEKQAEETKAALDRQTKALNKIAKEAKNNPEVAEQVVRQKQMSDTRIKLFAAINPGTLNNLKGFASDIWKTQGSNIKKAGKVSLGFGAMGYAGNRITTSLKDHDEGNDKKNLGFLGKAALTGAALGGTYMAAKKGMLGKAPIKSLGDKSISQAVQGGMEKVGRAVNPIKLKKDPNAKFGYKGIGETAMNAGFVALPVAGYLGQRKQQEDQVEQTRGYSDNGEKSGLGSKLLKTGLALGGAAGTIALARKGKLGAGTQRFVGNATAQIGGTLKAAGATNFGKKLAADGSKTYASGLRNGKEALSDIERRKAAISKFKDATAPNKISGGFSKFGSFFGLYGKGGTQAVQNTAKTLANSENAISQNVGKYLQEHKTLANVGAGVGSLAAGGAILSAGNIPFKAFDKRAYDYEKQQTERVN